MHAFWIQNLGVSRHTDAPASSAAYDSSAYCETSPLLSMERARDVGEVCGRRGKGLVLGAREGRRDLHIEHVQRFHDRAVGHCVDAHPVFSQCVQIYVVRGVWMALANVALDRCDGGAFELEEDAIFVFDEAHLKESDKCK